MGAHVIGERRREPRRVPDDTCPGGAVQVPGARVLDVLDVSGHGLRCRLTHPVRPGRAGLLRVGRAGAHGCPRVAFVVRCQVVKVSRHVVQYEAAWALDEGWAVEY